MKKILTLILCIAITLCNVVLVNANPVVDMNGKKVLISGQLDISRLSEEEVRQVQLYYRMNQKPLVPSQKLGPLGMYWEQKYNGNY